MAKRQTGVRLSKRTDQQIQDFVDNFEMNQSDVIAAAVQMFHEREYEKRISQARYAPIYQDFYVQCKSDDSGSFAVTGEYKTYLKLADFDDLDNDTLLYCEIKHDETWPYSGVDFSEVIDNDLDEIIPQEPKRFCQAAMVATPKLSLI